MSEVYDYMVPAIDVVVNPCTPEIERLRPQFNHSFRASRFRVPDEIRRGISIARHLELMDGAGIRVAFLIAAKFGNPRMHEVSHQVPRDLVEAMMEEVPDRFRGLLGLDPYEGRLQLRELETAARNGFVGAHLYPHWFDRRPDDPLYYPLYEKCEELGLPIQMQVGQCLVYSKDRPLPSVGQPIALDRLAIDFPGLKIIGIHTGWPWVEEMISVAWKHENVYIGIDAYAPKYLPESLVHFIDSWGAGKVMFGTDWPLIPFERAARETEELGLRRKSLEALKWKTAVEVYGLTDESIIDDLVEAG